MKAMILAAGLGTRLRPLTLERAKPAIPVCGKPLIQHAVHRLGRLGISSFRVNLSWLPSTVSSVFKEPDPSGFDVTFSHEPIILGTAGGLKANQDFFETDTFIMVNGDILFDFKLDEAINFHRQTNALATLILLRQTPPFQYTPVRMDKFSNITSFAHNSNLGEPTAETYIFTGIHILEPRIFQYIESGIFFEIISQAYKSALYNGEPILGFPVEGYWNDLGNPVRYLEAVKDALSGRLDSLPIKAWISPTASVHDTAQLTNVTIEKGSMVESGCMIENSIIWENSIIRKGSVLRNCILGKGVEIRGNHFDEVITVNGSEPVKC